MQIKAEKLGSKFITTESKMPAKNAKVVCESENSLAAPSTASFSAFIVECGEFKSRFEAVEFERQCIPGLTEEKKQSRAKVVDI